MVNCPACNAEIDIEEEDVDEGDLLSCDECGASLRVAGLNPLDLHSADEDDEEDDEDFFEDEDEEEDEESEEAEEEGDWR